MRSMRPEKKPAMLVSGNFLADWVNWCKKNENEAKSGVNVYGRGRLVGLLYAAKQP